jgi:hypothetical protein
MIKKGSKILKKNSKKTHSSVTGRVVSRVPIAESASISAGVTATPPLPVFF